MAEPQGQRAPVLRRRLLGQKLKDRGLITESQLRHALGEQEKSGRPLGEILVDLEYISEETLYEILAEEAGTTYIDLRRTILDPKALGRLPLSEARKHNVIPVALDGGAITIAMEDALDVHAIDRVREVTGCEVRVRVAARRDIEEALERFYGRGTVSLLDLIEDVAREIRAGAEDGDESAVEAPVIRLANHLIYEGLNRGASDIHIEQHEGRGELRIRIDGVLEPGPAIPAEVVGALILRIKVMSGLDISERRRPQGGRIRFDAPGRPVDLRIATMPTIFGENVVIRILKQDISLFEIEKIGFLPDQLEAFKEAIQAPQGIILVTGPTGCGKSTTLYSALRALPVRSLKVVTLEDPVEYELQDIQQTHVNPEAGVTFAAGLRALLRQDPDVLLVGEVRDEETAQLAIRAALTGHLVLTTLHTNDAIGAIPRLRDMGIERYLLASTIRAVVAQRLVRLVCAACAFEEDVPVRALGALAGELPDPSLEAVPVRRGAGCEACRGSGYKGRTGILELLLPSEGMRQAVLAGSGAANELEDLARRGGMVTLRRAGVLKMLDGQTTPEEVLRVT